jgi:hypothetical protein
MSHKALIAPVAAVAALFMVSVSFAGPSCCDPQNNSAALTAPAVPPLSVTSVPPAPERVSNRNLRQRQITRVTSGWNSPAVATGYEAPVRSGQPSGPGAPSCCGRPAISQAAPPRGCCGGPAAPQAVPPASCCGSPALSQATRGRGCCGGVQGSCTGCGVPTPQPSLRPGAGVPACCASAAPVMSPSAVPAVGSAGYVSPNVLGPIQQALPIPAVSFSSLSHTKSRQSVDRRWAPPQSNLW